MYKRTVPKFDPTKAFSPIPSKDDYLSSMRKKRDRLNNPFRERVASYFMSQPHQWIDGLSLESVGGRYAWRTRISDCRHDLHMTIENRQRWSNGRKVSEYRYIPDESTEEFCLTMEDDRAPRSKG
jgi:hypothetical protein